MPDLLAPQPYKIVITRFFPMLHFKLLRKIHGTNNQFFFGLCASINDKNCNYMPYKSFTLQNHLLISWKKTQGKIRNTGKTQGKHKEFYLSWNVAPLQKCEIDLTHEKYPSITLV